MKHTVGIVAVLAILLCSNLLAGSKEPVSGERFVSLTQVQHPDLHGILVSVFPESDGYAVLGPLWFVGSDDKDIAPLFTSKIVLCPDVSSLESAASTLMGSMELETTARRSFICNADSTLLPGYRGVFVELKWDSKHGVVQLLTPQQLRWLIWARPALSDQLEHELPVDLRRYMIAVSDYLYAVDEGKADTEPPLASSYSVSSTVDLYAATPDYVISGYQNYKDTLSKYSGIYADFGRGILSFVPTDSLLQAMKAHAPEEAYPNKEHPMFQAEMKKFFERGGDLRSINTLTADGYDTLSTGEYFFAVSVSGKVRFGRELLREEVTRIEKETGRKVPRANHAFLFPGEPILTAGAFFIERDSVPRIVEVNAQSGHYFYSNVSSTVREDIAVRSNRYLLTLGHFFKALDSIGIEYHHVLISKF